MININSNGAPSKGTLKSNFPVALLIILLSICQQIDPLQLHRWRCGNVFPVTILYLGFKTFLSQERRMTQMKLANRGRYGNPLTRDDEFSFQGMFRFDNLKKSVRDFIYFDIYICLPPHHPVAHTHRT